jgi:UMF1 family MFS transporter
VYYRKRLLLAFAWTGSFAAILHIFLPNGKNSSIYLAAGLSIIAVASFGNSFVCLNAYMGQLVQEDPDITTLQHHIMQTESEEPQRFAQNGQETPEEEVHPLLSTEALDSVEPESMTKNIPTSQSALDALISLRTTQISALGIAVGYAAGVAVLALSSIPVSRSGGSLDALQGVIGFSGAWWAVFTLPSAFWLPTQQAITSTPPTRVDVADRRGSYEPHLLRNKIKEGWSRAGLLFNKRELHRLSQCYWFLLAWALLADGTTR